MWLRPLRRFVRPPASVYRDPEREFLGGCHTYGEYNYLRPGLVARVKLAHFEEALALAEPWFGATGALDFGCADGVFLPSLARHFPRVLAVDRVHDFTELAERVVRAVGAPHVRVVCNADLGPEALRAHADAVRPGVGFCLEVIEHVGRSGDLWAPKIALLREVLSLLAPPAVLVVSVPVMVGLPFLAQRAALRLSGGYREPLSWSELWRAGLLADTRALEPRFDGGHLGFNHRRLEREMRVAGLPVERRVHTGFQVLYRLRAGA